MTRFPGLDPSQTMRTLLATEGIFLDEPRAIATATPSPTTCSAPVDRALVREILSERGAPDRDLHWLTASAPSVEHALAFEPTPWMLRDFADCLDEQRTIAGLGPGGKGRP